MSSEEDNYFKERELEKLAKARREQQLTAIRQGERESIKDVLQSSDEIAAEALDLGFDSETARVLPLVPVIQMAWIDGTVTAAESEKVVSLADGFGIDVDSPAHNFLTLLLGEQPSDIFFERVNRVIGHLVEEQPNYWNDKSIVDLSKEVAEASGGFFSLTDPINAQERTLLTQFAKTFSVDKKGAADVITKDQE
jgi:hypothetical protein